MPGSTPAVAKRRRNSFTLARLLPSPSQKVGEGYFCQRHKSGLFSPLEPTRISRNTGTPRATGRNDVANKADSYVSGTSDAPLLGETIGRALDKAVQRWESREALVSP